MFNGEDVRFREAKCPKGGETQLVQKYASIICEGGVVGSTVQVEVCFYFVGPPMDTVYESKSEGFWGCCESWERGGTPQRQEREQEVLEIRRVLRGDGPFPALEFVVMQWAQRAGEKGGGAEKLKGRDKPFIVMAVPANLKGRFEVSALGGSSLLLWS